MSMADSGVQQAVPENVHATFWATRTASWSATISLDTRLILNKASLKSAAWLVLAASSSTCMSLTKASWPNRRCTQLAVCTRLPACLTQGELGGRLWISGDRLIH